MARLGGFNQERDKAIQQIFMLNALVANKQQAMMSLFRMQSMRVSEDQILSVHRYLQEMSMTTTHTVI
jgi:hypothetical protein